jgi:hypothetical protein
VEKDGVKKRLMKALNQHRGPEDLKLLSKEIKLGYLMELIQLKALVVA